jgi:aminopeptidase YwaD
MRDQVEQMLHSEIHGGNALGHIKNICKFGDRFFGTEGDQRAFDYALKHFESLGLNIELINVRLPSYRELSVELILTDTDTHLEPISPFFAKSCREGICGEIVYVGEGLEEDYEGVDVQGKIVLIVEAATGWEWFWLGSFSKRAAAHGAVGLVIIHPFPWPNRMTMETGILDIEKRFYDQQVPTVCISAFDGLKVMKHIGEGKASALIRIDSEVNDADGVILSGVIEGSMWPNERIALIGHRDSPIPPAANDNGSGFGCQLEIARVLSRFKPMRSVEFICSTGEESASPGAYCYVEANKARLPDMKALINIDMVGVGGALHLVTANAWHETKPFDYSSRIIEVMEEVADGLGYGVRRMKVGSASEESRFVAEGVPVVAFWKWDDYCYHSVHDTPEKVDANSLKAVSDIAAISIWRLANAELS